MTITPETAAGFLSETSAEPADAAAHLHGFGGLHGGLVLARLTAVMTARWARDAPLRAVTAQYHRPVRERFAVTTHSRRLGTGTTTASADAVDEAGEALVSAGAIFGAPRHAGPVVDAPAPPDDVRTPEQSELFAVPTEFVPVAASTEIRAVGSNRPYEGGTKAELTAWVRMVNDDEPPGPLRLIFLMDALAPSYAALLTEPRAVPTVELSVHPRADAQATSPWVLLHARTLGAAGGWVDEHIDAWDVSGTHLGSARQVRVVH